MDITGVAVLLVGTGVRNAPALTGHLLRRGCEIFRVAGKKEALDLLQCRRFDVVLSEFLLPDGTALQLTAPLLGTGATLFFFTTVEDGCWWMSAVCEGEDRSGEPAMRPAEFGVRLSEILHAKLLHNEKGSLAGPGDACSGSPGTRGRRIDDFYGQGIPVKQKGETNMKSTEPGPSLWHFVPASPGVVAAFRRWNIVIFSALGLLVLGLLFTGLVPGAGSRSFAANKVPLKIDKDPAPVNLASFKNGYASVIDPALPAVVNISSTKMVKQQNNFPGFSFDDPFFRQFFGNQFNQQPAKPEMQREYSLGSGVIVNPDGYILTNNHVVDGATDIEVFTQDKKKFRAKLIGTDPRTDVAVLKIEAAKLPFLSLGDSSQLKVGDVVFAIGDPFGVGETATTGIVSATGRALGGAIEHYEDFIQTDAAINPGNSGGALIDLHGDLIGINTAILSGGGGGNQGIGFAIPINMARNVMEQIVDHGKVTRGLLGVSIQGVDADMAKAFGLAQGGGALVADVTPGSAAAKAGVERGDIILELDGKAVSTPDDLSVRISQIAPGTAVHLKISRNGQMLDLTATLGELSETAVAAASGEPGAAALQGIQVQNLTPAIAQELGISGASHGVVIASVDPSSAAAAAGLQRGDVIQEVNRKPVHTVAEYDHALAGIHDQSILLLVNRGSATRFVVIQPK